MFYAQHGDYRKTLFKMLAFLLRYGPKSIDEILSKSVRWNLELATEIGEIMKQEKDIAEKGLMTGDS